jgi:hypothetical protein
LGNHYGTFEENDGVTSVKRVRLVSSLTVIVLVDGRDFDAITLMDFFDKTKGFILSNPETFGGRDPQETPDVSFLVMEKGAAEGVPLDDVLVPVPVGTPDRIKKVFIDSEEEH